MAWIFGNPEDVVSDGLSYIADAFVAITVRFARFLFAVDPLETEGVWPFGRPVASSAVNPDAGLTGGLLPYFASQAFDVASPEAGGEMLIFALIMFTVLFAVGGYAQFFDWTLPQPNQKRDPVYGVVLMLFWFPLYFAVLTVSHELFLIIMPHPTELIPVIIGMITSILAIIGLGIGLPLIGIAAVGLVVFSVLMYARAILAAAYLVFGPVLVAIAWADLYGLSEQAIGILKYSVGIALAPLGIPVVMWIYVALYTGEIPPIGSPTVENIINTILPAIAAVSILFGVIVFNILIWGGLFLSWKIFRKSGSIVDKVGGTAARLGSAAGVYHYGSRRDAVRTLKYGPTSVAGKKAFNRGGNRGSGDGGGGSDGGDSGDGGDSDGGERSWNPFDWADRGRR